MIKIREGNAVKHHTKKSLFIAMDYDPELLERLKTLPKRYYIPNTKEWEIPHRYVNEFLDMFQDQEMEIISNVRSDVANLIGQAAMFDVSDVSPEFKTEPYPHQIESFEYAMNLPKFLLADQQGLGKTKQALDIAVARKLQFNHCLIVCGINSTKWQWMKQVEQHTSEQSHLLGHRIISRGPRKGAMDDGDMSDRIHDLENLQDIDSYFLVTNIETLRNKRVQELVEKYTVEGQIGFVVIDEIQKAINSQSQQGDGIHSLRSFYKMALTGTPIMNSPLDAYNVMKWLGIEKRSWTAFSNRYAILDDRYQVLQYKNLGELKARLGAVTLRRLKSSIKGLPPKVRSFEYVDMNDEEIRLYYRILSNLREEADKIKLQSNPLAQFTRLRQALTNPSIITDDVGQSSKILRAEELVREAIADGEKVIVFGAFAQSLRPLMKNLSDMDVASGIGEDGKVDSEVTRFKDSERCNVLVGTIAALGTGYDIPQASKVIFLENPWTWAAKEQSEDRAHRVITKHTVQVITLMVKNTIDEKIQAIVEDKKKYADLMLEAPEQLEARTSSELVDYLLA